MPWRSGPESRESNPVTLRAAMVLAVGRIGFCREHPDQVRERELPPIRQLEAPQFVGVILVAQPLRGQRPCKAGLDSVLKRRVRWASAR